WQVRRACGCGRDGSTGWGGLRLRGCPWPDAVKSAMRDFRGRPQELKLPTAPEHPIHVRDGRDRPQPILDRDTERGMAAVVGRVREDPAMGIKYVVRTHNTIRGAAVASILTRQLLPAGGCLGT